MCLSHEIDTVTLFKSSMAALQYTNYMIMDIYYVLYVSFTTRKYLDEFALPISLVKLQASCFIVMLHVLSIALAEFRWSAHFSLETALDF